MKSKLVAAAFAASLLALTGCANMDRQTAGTVDVAILPTALIRRVEVVTGKGDHVDGGEEDGAPDDRGPGRCAPPPIGSTR